ncbi:hypothetical protein FKG94_01495 [Exilibacterium tricleocarpae]|uniref:Twin-arginine translocation signal domain-containing protein n=1 Tax=Exilibacterium tricleocarpae TaxID=2591008 RepID=A0A545U9W0_9GAMM|nr:hypothetical protein [Exilibacterium tricleocarpae]TQV86251.1 hypothetical protein FKG94_01495 [Exilibacterium tricleocarpae]
MSIDRRKFLGMGAVLGAASVAYGRDALQAEAPTPAEIEGPRGCIELVTQMYFPDVKLNEKDRLLQSKSAEERAMMIASHNGHTEKSERILSYNIVLKKSLKK